MKNYEDMSPAEIRKEMENRGLKPLTQDEIGKMPKNNQTLIFKDGPQGQATIVENPDFHGKTKAQIAAALNREALESDDNNKE